MVNLNISNLTIVGFAIIILVVVGLSTITLTIISFAIIIFS
jgi:hypothetical protein